MSEPITEGHWIIRPPNVELGEIGTRPIVSVGPLVEEFTEVMPASEHEEFRQQLLKILHDYDHDGEGNVIEMAEVAMTAYGFTKHTADTREERIEELEGAIITHSRTRPVLVRQHEEGRQVNPDAADKKLWEVLDKNRPSPVDLIESELKISELAKARKIIFALITAIRHMARERPILDECWYAMQYAEDLVPTMVPTIDEINEASAVPVPNWLAEGTITVKWELLDGDHRLIFKRDSSMAVLSAGGEIDHWEISGADLLKLLHLVVSNRPAIDDEEETQ